MQKVYRYAAIVFLVILLLPIACVVLFSVLLYQSSFTYVDVVPPKISAGTNRELIIALIQRDEDFSGTIAIDRLPFDTPESNPKEEITYRNNYSGDDSIGPSEYKMIAEFSHNKWTIIKSKMHWQCSRDLFFSSVWRTSGSCD